MIADASQISYIHGFAPFLAPQRVCSRADLSDSQNPKTCCFTQRKVYTEKMLHTEAFTERDLHRAAFTQTLLHTDAFTHRSFCTEKPFLKKPYHMKPLHRAALHTDAFSQRSFYTQEL